jgi:tetratricopeptide (TPR) repeat protein
MIPSRACRRFAATIAVFLWGVHLLLAQPITDFTSAWAKRDFVAARRWLPRAFTHSKETLVERVADVEYLLLEYGAKGGEEIAKKPQTDTLIRIYDLACSLQSGNKAPWLARKAMLAARFPQHYPSQTLTWIEDAIQVAPYECPLHLYSLWADEVDRKMGGNAGNYAWMWLKMDRLLYRRSLFRPEESDDCIRLEQHLGHHMAAMIPPCENIESAWMAQNLAEIKEQTIMNYLATAHLGRCNDSLGRTKAVDWLSSSRSIHPDFSRIMAMEAMERREYECSISFWEKAIAHEDDAEAKAGDLLFLGEIQKLQGRHAEARRSFEEASRLLPMWGEPYIRLADLYVDGSAACRLADFDQKVLCYLLVDLCRIAASADPTYGEESARRIRQYLAKMPSKAELELRGLMEGDTWPLRCWIGKAVVVRTP